MANFSKFLSLISGVDRTVDLSAASSVLELGGSGLQMDGSTSGHISITASATTTTYSMIWPSAQASTPGFVLSNDGTGVLSWAAAATSLTIGPFNNTSTANGLDITSSVLTLHAADGTNPGAVSTTTQTFAGNKTFTGTIGASNFSGSSSGTNTGDQTITLTSDVTGSGTGSFATTVAKIQGTTVSGTTGTGNVAFSASPTFTGTLAAAAASFTGILNMNSNKITSLSAGTTSTDAVNYGQVILASGVNAWTGNQSLGGNIITNSGSPVNPNDLVTKVYVDNFINATSWKTAVVVSSTGNIDLSVAADPSPVDGVTLADGNRILLKNQAAPAQNGIYIAVTAIDPTTWTRSTDMSTWAEVPAAAVFVESGTVGADLGWVCTSQPGGTIGTTAITFVQFSSAGSYSADGVTLQLISSVFSIKNAGVGTTQLANNGVTYAKIQTESASTLLGNPTGSTANVSEITLGATLTFSGSALQTTAFTGDVTSSANSFATTVSKIQGTTVSGTTGSGNVVFSASPTLTGTITAAAANFSGAISASNFSGSSSGTNTGDQTITLTGDVTGSGTGSFATTIAAGAVTATKLGTVTDGITTDQSGAGSTIEVLRSPSLKRTLVAGQSFSANTSYAVRWGLTSNSETANRVYAADTTTSSFDLFYVIGMASSGSAVSAGQNITVTTMGSFNLSSSDTAFAASTDGLAVFLTASGTFSVTSPSSSGLAVTRVGMVQVRSATPASNIIDVFPVFVGVN